MVSEFDLCGVEAWVKFAADGQSGGGCSVGDEVDDGFICLERASSPILRDSGEEPVLNFVPFASSRRVVGDCDFKSGRGGKSRELMFPEPNAVSVGPSAVGSDEDFSRIRILFFAHVLPPFFYGCDSEDPGVVVDTHGNPRTVVVYVVYSVGNGLTVRLIGEIVS